MQIRELGRTQYAADKYHADRQREHARYPRAWDYEQRALLAASSVTPEKLDLCFGRNWSIKTCKCCDRRHWQTLEVSIVGEPPVVLCFDCAKEIGEIAGGAQ